MRVRNKKNKDIILNNCEYLLKDNKNMFDNDNPIHIEIGMGKGGFIREMAQMNPDINYIGIEKSDSILAIAIENTTPLKNLKYLLLDADKIDEFFDKDIDLIYFTFSDPWPKTRHAKRRITYKSFLEKYDKIFKTNAHICLKTDNNILFTSSIVNLSEYGYIINRVDLNFISEDNNLAITEYEDKFRKKNVNIKYLEATKKL